MRTDRLGFEQAARGPRRSKLPPAAAPPPEPPRARRHSRRPPQNPGTRMGHSMKTRMDGLRARLRFESSPAPACADHKPCDVPSSMLSAPATRLLSPCAPSSNGRVAILTHVLLHPLSLPPSPPREDRLNRHSRRCCPSPALRDPSAPRCRPSRPSACSSPRPLGPRQTLSRPRPRHPPQHAGRGSDEQSSIH